MVIQVHRASRSPSARSQKSSARPWRRIPAGGRAEGGWLLILMKMLLKARGPSTRTRRTSSCTTTAGACRRRRIAAATWTRSRRRTIASCGIKGLATCFRGPSSHFHPTFIPRFALCSALFDTFTIRYGTICYLFLTLRCACCFRARARRCYMVVHGVGEEGAEGHYGKGGGFLRCLLKVATRWS
ncbi:hypothetical protein PLEOSDRAFT_1090557 [Pleurotus ostreatus PC15]|uniref:Uncharacterized protein n=1 Tax=Pleurotus ostreatus (strain PC15) TaxID=1137138 RepID=A0A067NHL0_PLEO1|nr:hypothetical protein PLEOSDRAFT_1090557 [Pleurotus ostreatus PC15]